MNCHLRDYIFCFCCRLLHLVPNSRGFLWICSDQVSVFQELSSSDESFCSVLFWLPCSYRLLKRLMLLWITYFETETFSRNVIYSVGSSHTLCVLWKELRLAAPPYWMPNQIRWIACRNIAYCLNVHLEFFNCCREGCTNELPLTGLHFLLLLPITASSAK